MGELEFSAGSDISFQVLDENGNTIDGHSLDWADTKEFIKNLRETADFLERHVDKDIYAYVD